MMIVLSLFLCAISTPPPLPSRSKKKGPTFGLPFQQKLSELQNPKTNKSYALFSHLLRTNNVFLFVVHGSWILSHEWCRFFSCRSLLQRLSCAQDTLTLCWQRQWHKVTNFISFTVHCFFPVTFCAQVACPGPLPYLPLPYNAVSC